MFISRSSRQVYFAAVLALVFSGANCLAAANKVAGAVKATIVNAYKKVKGKQRSVSFVRVSKGSVEQLAKWKAFFSGRAIRAGLIRHQIVKFFDKDDKVVLVEEVRITPEVKAKEFDVLMKEVQDRLEDTKA